MVVGFTSLCQSDQLLLIKFGFTEAWIVKSAFLFNGVDGLLLFADGSAVPKHELAIIFMVGIHLAYLNYSLKAIFILALIFWFFVKDKIFFKLHSKRSIT